LNNIIFEIHIWHIMLSCSLLANWTSYKTLTSFGSTIEMLCLSTGLHAFHTKSYRDASKEKGWIEFMTQSARMMNWNWWWWWWWWQMSCH
jgi:hypothetical protein